MSTKNIPHFCLAALLLLCGGPLRAAGEAPELLWQLEGFENPESVVYNPALDHLYVSNVNGGPVDKDGNGYLSIVSPDGRLLQEKWITGLNAPKGLALRGRTLYVTDIDELVEINIDNGRVKKYQVDDARFLNDAAACADGAVYVSDMLLNRIHSLRDDDFSIWLETGALENPNGLLCDGGDLIVASWGRMTDGFGTETPGHLKRVSLAGGEIESIGAGTPVGNLDGVEGSAALGFYVTDWVNGGLFHISARGEANKLLDLNQGSADLEWIMEKDLLLIPLMRENKLLGYKIRRQ